MKQWFYIDMVFFLCVNDYKWFTITFCSIYVDFRNIMDTFKKKKIVYLFLTFDCPPQILNQKTRSLAPRIAIYSVQPTWHSLTIVIYQ